MNYYCHFFFIMIRRLPIYTLFPYTTLFRSRIMEWSFMWPRTNFSRGASRKTPPSDGFGATCFCAPEWNDVRRSRRTSRARSRRSEEHTSELQSHHDLVCRLLLEKKKIK